MADLAYLLARLPTLYPDSQLRPVGVAEFLGMIADPQHRHWCAAVLDWLRIANQEARALQLPLPFPDAGEPPPAARGGEGLADREAAAAGHLDIDDDEVEV